MGYYVQVEYSPIYELLVSLEVYIDRSRRKMAELPPDWAAGVREALPPGFEAECKAILKTTNVPLNLLLPMLCPVKDSLAGLRTWVEALSLGELYELVAPYLSEGSKMPQDWVTTRETWLRLITAWDEAYFRHLNPVVLQTLRADAEARQRLVGQIPPGELIERTTGGLVLEAPPEIPVGQVLLIPQYHSRPLNLIEHVRGLVVFLYPVDLPPASADMPSHGLMRLTRALADESRLRILRFVAQGERTFTEVVVFTGLAKSTVHHHMGALRAAGLVRVHIPTDRYSLRQDSIGRLGDRLAEYLKGE